MRLHVEDDELSWRRKRKRKRNRRGKEMTGRKN